MEKSLSLTGPQLDRSSVGEILSWRDSQLKRFSVGEILSWRDSQLERFSVEKIVQVDPFGLRNMTFLTVQVLKLRPGPSDDPKNVATVMLATL